MDANKDEAGARTSLTLVGIWETGIEIEFELEQEGLEEGVRGGP